MGPSCTAVKTPILSNVCSVQHFAIPITLPVAGDLHLATSSASRRVAESNDCKYFGRRSSFKGCLSEVVDVAVADLLPAIVVTVSHSSTLGPSRAAHNPLG